MSAEAIEVLRGVVGEVEIELGNPTLHQAPHRLAEVGHEPHQPYGGNVSRSLLAEVGGHQHPVLIDVELLVGRQVAQVEEAIAHTRVLPIHDPDLAVVEEVGVQEVVVAGNLRLRAARLLDPV